jgi:hypothetical protein
LTVFVWVRYLSVALLPLTFFVTARLLKFSPLEAAAAALLSPLISTNFLFGLEYGSYLWAGSGLFTQSIASHFFLLSVGFGFRSLRSGSHIVITGVLVALAFLSNFIYGYMAALTIILAAVIPDEAPRATRAKRMVVVGLVAFAFVAWELVPMLAEIGAINHSRWEPVWKWDSFGAGQVLTWLFTGELLDHGRLPVLSVLVLFGTGAAIWAWRRDGVFRSTSLFALSGAALWILVYFGRPFWGPALRLLGVMPDLQVHRAIGGVHFFLVLLGAIGLATIWRLLYGSRRVVAAVVVTAVLLYPAFRERGRFLSNNNSWGRQNLAAFAAEQPQVDSVLTDLQSHGGRAYAGLAASWGGSFKVGDVPFYAFMSTAHVPAVAFLYHSMALTGDIMVRFNETRPDHYRLFNIRSVVAPATAALPDFLTPRAEMGRFKVFDSPGTGYFDVVDVPAAVRTTRRNFYDVNDRWLQSDWVGKRQHLLLTPSSDVPSGMLRLSDYESWPSVPSVASAGLVENEHQDGQTYEARLQAERSSFALFRMTWHPGWKAYVDGRPERTVMLAPGFVGVPLAAGHHAILLRYEAGKWKGVFAICGLLLVTLIAVLEYRGYQPLLKRLRLPALTPTVARRRILTGVGLVLLSLPVCISLFTSSLADGHDAFEYFPRMVEFHQNISNGILVPRWAPDLSRGTGQPLFLFNPPIIYYLAEVWHLLGFDFITALNLACVVLVLASALGMFLLGRLHFGDAGGWLAAAAYLYAPYYSVNLYVRSDLAEFAAFPFFAFALYGFGAYGRHRERRYLLLGALSYAGVLLSHNASALFFTPLLLAYIGLIARIERSWSVFRSQVMAWLGGLGLAAFVWIPALVERDLVNLGRLLQGYLRYSNHFVYLHQLFFSRWDYGVSVAGDQDGMSFALGWSHLLLAVIAGIWIARTRGADRRWFRFFAICALAGCVLMLQDAVWLWDHVPLLQYVEFPWRLLGPVAVCIALLVGALGPLISSMPRLRVAAFASAMALLVVPNLSHMQPKEFRDIDLALWTPQQIAARGIEVTTAAEYSPRWMEVQPSYNPRHLREAAGQADIQEQQRTPVGWSGSVKAHAPWTAEFSVAWFPGWQVQIDGSPVAAIPAPSTGLIRFDVPAGDHQIELGWTRTTPRRVGDTISLASLLVLALAARRRQAATVPQAAQPAAELSKVDQELN